MAVQESIDLKTHPVGGDAEECPFMKKQKQKE